MLHVELRIGRVPLLEVDVPECEVIEWLVRPEAACFAEGERLQSVGERLIQVSSE